MNNYQIAAHVVANALYSANAMQEFPLSEETLIQLSGALSSAVLRYGATKRRKIFKSGMNVTTDFEQIASDFFMILRETPLIAEQVHTKDYAEITEFIAQNADLSPKERRNLYWEEHATSLAKFCRVMKKIYLVMIILVNAACVAMLIFQPEVREELRKYCKKMKQFAVQAMKFLVALGKAGKFLIHQMRK